LALSPAQAALIRLSAAIAAGTGSEIEARGSAALAAGLSPERVYEVVLQSYLFVGFPRAIEAFFAVAPLFRERGFKPRVDAADPARWRREGEELCRRVYGRNYEKLVSVMRDLSPDLAESMIVEGYGKILSRPGLGPVDRELAVVAVLTVTRMWRQLRSHAIGAVNVGAARADVKDAIELCAPWSGDAGVSEALAVTGLSERGSEGDA
jgi:4-carboxymuconolactone decarboxylase